MNKAFTIIFKACSEHLRYLETFFLANVFVWFHKNFSINFYNVSKSKKWPKIRKFRGFGPLKIEPMELRTRKKDVWGFIHPRTTGINAGTKIFFIQKPCSF